MPHPRVRHGLLASDVMYGRDVIYAELYPQRVAKRGVIYASDGHV